LPYLTDVNEVNGSYAAFLVSLLGISMMVGNVGLGAMAKRMERMGLGLYAFGGTCMVLFLLTQALIMMQLPMPLEILWAAYGVFGSASILVFAFLAGEYSSELLGRVASTTNMLIFIMIFLCQVGMGWVVDWWPQVDGVYPRAAHLSAWGVMLALQAGSACWYFWPKKPKQAQPA
jgi:MFS family permease